MSKKIIYNSLHGLRERKSFLSKKDFKPKESDEIIMNLIKRIEDWGGDWKREVDLTRTVSPGGEERITEVRIKGKDGVVKGVIEYGFAGICSAGIGERNGRVTADFDFNSGDISSKEKYLELAKILREI